VLRLQAQAKRLLELEGRRRHAAAGKAHQEARGDHHAFAERRDAALRDVAAMQKDFAVEIRRHLELAVGRDSAGEAPREPPRLPPRHEPARRDQRERITRRLLRP